MEGEKLPTSLDEVESLVHQLYRPGASGNVGRVQEVLQQLQRSPQGWQLAHSLMSNKDEQIRFFGALTFTVKLNTDAKSLSDEDADNLLTTLVDFLIKALNNYEGPLVVRKLCSTLVAYFLQFPSKWTRCLKHITYCLCQNQAVPYAAIADTMPNTVAMIDSLPTQKAVAIFWFSGGLVEEVGKMDSNSMKQHQFHQQVLPNVDDAVPLISRYISEASLDIKVRNEALKCFQAWASYAHRAFIDDHIVLDSLRTLTKPTIMCIAEDDLYETAIDTISEILGNYSKFLLQEDFQILFSLLNSPWAQDRYERLVQGDYDFDSLQFGLLILAFGDANTQDLTTNIGNNSEYERFLPVVCGLLNAEGFAVHEDKIFVPALEFWTTYVETVLDGSYDDEDGKERWLPSAKSIIFQALEHCMRKLQFPPAQVFCEWDSVDRTGFKDARRDFSDLIQQFYLVTGIEIMDFFIRHADQAINTRNWAELEIAWFVILSLCDSISEHDQRDEYLGRVLNTSVLAMVMNATDLPTRAKRTFLELVKGYSDYFVANTENLPTVLNIVFSATSSPTLASLAAHSISKLCSECRTILLPELDAFLQQYGSIANTSSLDGVIKEGVIEGIAALIQAIASEESKITPLSKLLDFVEHDVEQCLQLVAQETSDIANTANFIQDASGTNPAQTLGLVALKCLEGMAKGSQVPADVPVDLEPTNKEQPSLFWTEGEGARLQHRIVTMLHKLLGALNNHGEIVEASCQVLRKGFQESDPGPFVLPPEVAAQIILRSNSQTPRLGFVIRTASNLVYTQKGAQVDSVSETLLQWVSQLLNNLAEPGNDPEIAQDGIEFLTRMLPRYLHIFLNLQPPGALEYLFMFTLKAIAGSDPLPKAAACDFWTTFTSLSDLTPQLQNHLTSILQHFGPLLAQALIYNVGGHAARSELDKLAEPIRKLVVRHPQVKGWLEGALYADTFPSQHVGDQEKKVWLMKVMSQRGGKLTNQVVREFWLACRGSNFSYAS